MSYPADFFSVVPDSCIETGILVRKTKSYQWLKENGWSSEKINSSELKDYFALKDDKKFLQALQQAKIQQHEYLDISWTGNRYLNTWEKIVIEIDGIKYSATRNHNRTEAGYDAPTRKAHKL